MTGKSCQDSGGRERGRARSAAAAGSSQERKLQPCPVRSTEHIFRSPPPIPSLGLTHSRTHFHFAFHRRGGASLSHSPTLGAVHAAAAAPPRCLDTFRSKLFLCRRLPARKEVAYFFVAPSSRVVLFHVRLDVFNLTLFLAFLSAHHTCVMFLGLGITGGGTFLEASSSAPAPGWDRFPTVMVNSSGIC